MIVLISETFGGHEMKKTSYKNTQFVLIGMAFLSVAGLTGCSKVELSESTVTLELGEELSDNVADYLENSDKKVLSSAELDLSAVDESKVGSYSAKISYNNKDYPFTVNVIDTTAPECEATDYLYIQPGTVKVDDLIRNIKDASETSSGIVSCEKKNDLAACVYTEMLKEKAAINFILPYDDSDYQDSIELTEEGCYAVTAQVKDSEGNFTNVTTDIYVDGTAPELVENLMHLDVDASSINVDDIDTDDAEKIADMLHELPNFTDAEWAVASDAFCQDNKISYKFEQKSFNLQKENPVEVLNVHCTVQDQAGNEKKADYEVTVTYTGLDAAALIEKTGLILQTSDVTANEKKSGKSDKKSGTTNTQNQVSQASGKSNTNSLGITDDELVEMFNSMTPDEIDEFLNSLFEDNSNDNSNISGYYDSNYAQQVFAMVNQERANNGVDALTWDSSMASYSDRRAMEITTDFSHNSAGGKMNVGENIAEGAISPEMVMDGWMRSDGHRANILNASYTKISVSCYYDGSTYYWVQNFAY